MPPKTETVNRGLDAAVVSSSGALGRTAKMFAGLLLVVKSTAFLPSSSRSMGTTTPPLQWAHAAQAQTR